MRKRQCIYVRKATEKDAVPMAKIYFSTIRIINSNDYSATGIEAWSGLAPDPEKWKRRLMMKVKKLHQALRFP